MTHGLPVHLPDEDATAHWAARWAQATRSAALATPNWSMQVDLRGDLGVGKTTLVRHLLRGLGVAGRIKSPTFAVMEPYAVALEAGAVLNVSHFDLYRFADPREWAEAGFRDVLAAPGLKLVEWPDKGLGALPQPDLALALCVLEGDARELSAQAHTQAGHDLLALLDTQPHAHGN